MNVARNRSAVLIVVLAAATLTFAACETEIDEGKAEEEIAKGYEEEVPGSEVESVDCPEIGNETGSTAVCTLTTADGDSGEIDVEVVDDDGTIEWRVADPGRPAKP